MIDLTRAHWRKSGRSGTTGNCVEVADLTDAVWRKSTRSGNTGSCVEVADNLAAVVAVRDSKDPAGPVLTVAPGSWSAFIADVRATTHDA